MAILAFLVLVPLAMLVLGSFSAARLPTDFSLSDLTADNYLSVYTDPLTYRVLGNTVVYVAGSLALGLSLSLLFAWLVARTNMPAKWLAYVGLPLALVMPGMLESMVWVLLFSPRIGFVNRLLMAAFGLSGAPFDVYSLPAMMTLEGLRMVPTGFLLLAPVLLRFDPVLEEAAATAGGRPGTIIRRVTLPLLVPALLSIALYLGVTVLSSFEVPGILGLPGRVYVFSTLIYTYTSATTSAGGNSYGAAAALAIIYLLINVGGMALYIRATRDAARFAVVSGRAYRPRLVNLGRWRWLALAVLVLHLCVNIVLPLLVLLWTSLMPRIVQPSVSALRELTFASWQRLAGDAQLVQVALNTLAVVLATATLTALASLAIAWIVTRTRFAGRRLLDQLAFASHGLPGVILALALIWFWVRIDALPVYGTLAIVVLGLVTGFLAYGTRTASAALLQVQRELEEAAYASGAALAGTMRRVLVPLLAPALTGLWVWVAIQGMRFVTLPLMLQTGPENTVVAAYLWRRWEAGEVNLVAAVGLALVATVAVLTAIVWRLSPASRRLSFTS
ncbi:MAG TPA: ABC transporter permease subunit [Chloroflexota bacterium]|nr:ABC transporter permease subunit [Chloroflexota bacterium]